MNFFTDLPYMRRELRSQAASIRNVVESLKKDKTTPSSLAHYWSEAAAALESITAFPLPGEPLTTRSQQFVATVARKAPYVAERLFPYDPRNLRYMDQIFMETAQRTRPGIDTIFIDDAKAKAAKELIENKARQYVSLVCSQYRWQHLRERDHPSMPLQSTR